jgi:quinol-cytochrome oxidoreductase complex cytochrome b subunit
VAPAVQPRTGAEKAMAWMLAAAGAEFSVLAVTGVLLIFFYRPSAANAWGGLSSHASTAVRVVGAIRFVHRLTARLMVVNLLAMAVLGLILAFARTLRTQRHGITAGGAIAIALVGLFASFTGFLLPWDQLALWEVTVGTNMMGFMPILHGARIQYVLIGGASVSAHVVRVWFYVHVLVVPIVLLALGGLVARRLLGRGGRSDRHTGLGS